VSARLVAKERPFKCGVVSPAHWHGGTAWDKAQTKSLFDGRCGGRIQLGVWHTGDGDPLRDGGNGRKSLLTQKKKSSTLKITNRDSVLQQVESTYDSNSNASLVTAKQRFHDETGTGALGTASNGVKARVSYAASYFDGADRLTGVVDFVTNGGTSYTRPSTVPSWSDTVRMVLHSGGGQQVTEWVYGVTTAGGSGLNSNDLVKEVRYPDPSTGASSSSSKDVLTVNALGQALTMTDRNGTVHSYSYDVVGRQAADAISTLLGHMWLRPRSCLVLLSPLFRPSLHGGDVGLQIFHILALQVAQVDSHLGIVTLGAFGQAALVVGFFHPGIEPTTQPGQRGGMVGLRGQIDVLPTVFAPAVQFLGRAGGREQQPFLQGTQPASGMQLAQPCQRRLLILVAAGLQHGPPGIKVADV
jgi:hypothetical protein